MVQSVEITRIWDETPEIRGLELTPVGPIADFSPGAHIDLLLPGGFIRQYSLWNGPEDRASYLIGVKRERESRGGSVAVHDLKVGETLEISAPKNNFELAPGNVPSILLAGGIGITPLLSMAWHLQAQGARHALHLFARDAAHAPFLTELSQLPEAPAHLALIPPTLDRVLHGILDDPDPSAHLYLCGPGPFMDLVERQAALARWPSERVHLERFSIDPDVLDISGDGFEVVLKQSGQSIHVNEGQTIIEAMEEAGITPLTSCEQGVCSTCLTNVIEGEPDHRDDYL